MASEDEHRGAIERTAQRIRESSQQGGREITYEQARDRAREIARRNERRTNRER